MKIKRILHNIYSKCTKKKMVYGPLTNLSVESGTDLFSKSSRLNFLHVSVQLIAHAVKSRSCWTDDVQYLYRRGNILLQERRSSRSPAWHIRLWNRTILHLDTDTASTGPYDTPRPPRTPSRHEHTWEKLQNREKNSSVFGLSWYMYNLDRQTDIDKWLNSKRNQIEYQ